MSPSKSVTIEVNNKPVVVPKEELTGLEIKEAAGIPVDFTLYEKKGTHLNEIGNDTLVKVHNNEAFVAVSGQDVS